ncbi:CCA tRNA nucleotidyltransferase [candidate division TA06 bacterium]|uniref:CCA tRNA nucleotidyltransferase n=1 Tax=candidate division TA06 bacterium TaxID=2250710 RepID=A0A523USZ5_UNCT6|nr:MAG: CCA tRNA nucleotidyltransferase [candidate division TA06 bacterium]
MNIKSLAQKLESLPMGAVLEAAEKKRVYLVGGPIRDFFLKREYNDIDLAVEGDAVGVARKFASKVKGRFIPLDAELDESRVVAGDYTYDFTGFPKGCLLPDLERRDFTINSVAVDLRELLEGEGVVIDPFGGLSDLGKKVLRATSKNSFREDPLRVLRAFRFAAELGFEIEKTTLKAATRERVLLKGVAAERISYEVMLIFSQVNSYGSLSLMAEASVLCTVFPQLEPTKGVAQNKLHPLDVFDHSLRTYQEMENVVNHLSSTPFAPFTGIVNEYLYSLPNKSALLKMAGLLHDIAKPETLQPGEDQRLHFYGHDRTGAEKIEEFALKGLRMSKKEAKTLFVLIKNHMWPHLLAGQDEVTERAIRKFFRQLGDEAIGVLVLAWADSLASVGPEKSSQPLSTTIDGILHFYTERKEEVVPPPLITGKDLIGILGLTPGPIFGKILKEVENERDEGKVQTKTDAIETARRIAAEYGKS